MPTPFYLESLPALREKLAKAERDHTIMGRAWSSVRRRAQAAPESFPWYTPFVALVTGEEDDLEAARQTIRRYVSTFESQTYGMGLQFHFWCFAFPHARWTLYYQWLDSIGAWSPEESQRLREELLTFQLVNFHYGMRTKPQPECVDNQTMSLCFSNALLGQLFGGPDGSPVANYIVTEGLRRLPDMLGGMPPSGYSGEGSTYMDHVVGPCLPFVVELLERAHGGDWYNRELPPAGGSARTIAQMIARQWMPNGLLLPWDHYGYQLPTRACVAYGAHKTGDPLYHELLEEHADWGVDSSVGWGWDDLVWTLVWWPGERPPASGPAFPSWSEPDIGGALVSDDSQLYLLQHWDHSTPGYPSRAHVNPNALVLSAFGSPLTVDGIPDKDRHLFEFDDTWHETRGAQFGIRRTNFGSGCGGAHGVLLVDGWEGMRAESKYEQATRLAFDSEQREVCADVSPIYRERWPETQGVRRRSRLVADRFWLIEDLAAFAGQTHQVTARFWLRPELESSGPEGLTLLTAEGVRLHLRPLLGPGNPACQRVEGYPNRLEEASICADFTQHGDCCRWLWLAFPEATRQVAESVESDWQVVADPNAEWAPDQARAALAETPLRLPLTLAPFMLAELPIHRRWWYRRTIRRPDGPAWLRLPRGMKAPALWIDGQSIDFAPLHTTPELLPPELPLPDGPGGELEVLLRVDCGVSQYNRQGDGITSKTGPVCFCGSADVLIATPTPPLAATRQDDQVTVTYGDQTWTVKHQLLPLPEEA